MSFLFKDGSLLPEIVGPFPRCRCGVQGMVRGLRRGCSTRGTCLSLKKFPLSPKNHLPGVVWLQNPGVNVCKEGRKHPNTPRQPRGAGHSCLQPPAQQVTA